MTLELQKFIPYRGVSLPRFAPRGKAPSDEILAETIYRIQDVVEPRKIIFFGSASREEMHPDSDLDFMVIVDPKDDKGPLSSKIHASLHSNLRNEEKEGLGFGYDVIVAIPKLMKELDSCLGTVYGKALQEGKTIYEC